MPVVRTLRHDRTCVLHTVEREPALRRLPHQQFTLPEPIRKFHPGYIRHDFLVYDAFVGHPYQRGLLPKPVIGFVRKIVVAVGIEHHMFHPRTVAAECNHQKYPHGVRRIIRRIPLPCLEFPHAGLLIDLPGTKTLIESLREVVRHGISLPLVRQSGCPGTEFGQRYGIVLKRECPYG